MKNYKESIHKLYEVLILSQGEQEKIIKQTVEWIKKQKRNTGYAVQQNDIAVFIGEEYPGMTQDELLTLARQAITSYHTVMSKATRERLTKISECFQESMPSLEELKQEIKDTAKIFQNLDKNELIEEVRRKHYGLDSQTIEDVVNQMLDDNEIHMDAENNITVQENIRTRIGKMFRYAEEYRKKEMKEQPAGEPGRDSGKNLRGNEPEDVPGQVFEPYESSEATDETDDADLELPDDIDELLKMIDEQERELDQFKERHIYIKSPSDAPKGVAVQKGVRGGHYYDTKDIPHTAPKSKVPKATDKKEPTKKPALAKGQKKSYDVMDKRPKDFKQMPVRVKNHIAKQLQFASQPISDRRMANISTFQSLANLNKHIASPLIAKKKAGQTLTPEERSVILTAKLLTKAVKKQYGAKKVLDYYNKKYDSKKKDALQGLIGAKKKEVSRWIDNIAGSADTGQQWPTVMKAIGKKKYDDLLNTAKTKIQWEKSNNMWYDRMKNRQKKIASLLNPKSDKQSLTVAPHRKRIATLYNDFLGQKTLKTKESAEDKFGKLKEKYKKEGCHGKKKPVNAIKSRIERLLK